MPDTNILLTLSQVIELTKLSRSTIYRYIPQKGFPQPRRIGERKVAWLTSEVTQWINDRVALQP